MRTIVKGKNVEVPDRVRDYTERKLRRLERLLDDRTDAIVEFSNEQHRSAADAHIAEVTLVIDGQVLRSSAVVVNEDDVDNMLALRLSAGPNRLYGDSDLDGDVDANDFDDWRLRDGYTDPGTGRWAIGDFDGDGDVDGTDLDFWRLRPANFPIDVGPHAGVLAQLCHKRVRLHVARGGETRGRAARFPPVHGRRQALEVR